MRSERARVTFVIFHRQARVLTLLFISCPQVPVQMRFYPLFGALEPEVVKFLGIARRDKLRLVTSCNTMDEITRARDGAGQGQTPLLPAYMEVSKGGRQ